jgi:hypothetical protein
MLLELDPFAQKPHRVARLTASLNASKNRLLQAIDGDAFSNLALRFSSTTSVP